MNWSSTGRGTCYVSSDWFCFLHGWAEWISQEIIRIWSHKLKKLVVVMGVRSTTSCTPKRCRSDGVEPMWGQGGVAWRKWHGTHNVSSMGGKLVHFAVKRQSITTFGSSCELKWRSNVKSVAIHRAAGDREWGRSVSQRTGASATTSTGSGVHLTSNGWWDVCSMWTVDAVDAALWLRSSEVVIRRFRRVLRGVGQRRARGVVQRLWS